MSLLVTELDRAGASATIDLYPVQLQIINWIEHFFRACEAGSEMGRIFDPKKGDCRSPAHA